MIAHRQTAALAAAAALACAVAAAPSAAQDKAAEKPAEGARLKLEDLTPEELKEREARKECKVRICAAFHNRQSDAGDVTCNVLKTWRKEQLSKMVERAKVSWPWGAVKCVADIRLRRGDLAKAMTEDKHEATLDKHTVACEVAREGDKPAEIKFDFTPKVTFEKGKATKASLNWGTVEGPAIVKGIMWTATGTDNTLNVLQGTVVEDINDFIGAKCDEVKADWQK